MKIMAFNDKQQYMGRAHFSECESVNDDGTICNDPSSDRVPCEKQLT